MYEDKSFYTTISVAEKTAKIVQLGPSNGLWVGHTLVEKCGHFDFTFAHCKKPVL